jgi:hypothetical protein
MTVSGLLVVALLAASAAWAQAQPLAEIARVEEVRRKAQPQGAKVYTNDELRADFTTPASPPPVDAAGAAVEPTADGAAAAPAVAAPPAAAAAPARDQAYWADRIGQARSQIERSRTFAIALQSRIDALLTDFVNRDNPVERDAIEQERVKALDELRRVNQEIAEQTQAISDIEDEARRAGVPAGWLRP